MLHWGEIGSQDGDTGSRAALSGVDCSPSLLTAVSINGGNRGVNPPAIQAPTWGPSETTDAKGLMAGAVIVVKQWGISK